MDDRRYDASRERGRSEMTEESVALLRYRVESRYYERPEVVDAVARAILRHDRADR